MDTRSCMSVTDDDEDMSHEGGVVDLLGVSAACSLVLGVRKGLNDRRGEKEGRGGLGDDMIRLSGKNCRGLIPMLRE